MNPCSSLQCELSQIGLNQRLFDRPKHWIDDDHPPYSPDLTSNDFSLFPHIKKKYVVNGFCRQKLLLKRSKPCFGGISNGVEKVLRQVVWAHAYHAGENFVWFIAVFFLNFTRDSWHLSVLDQLSLVCHFTMTYSWKTLPIYWTYFTKPCTLWTISLARSNNRSTMQAVNAIVTKFKKNYLRPRPVAGCNSQISK